MPLKVDAWVLYRSLKTKLYNVEVRGREFTESKYIFLKLNGRRWANGDWEELEILLKVTGTRCHLCGRRLAAKDVGYARVGRGVELALCEACLQDYLKWRGVQL